jgi:hypothetical protein
MYYLIRLYELLILYILDAKIHKYCTNSNFPPQMATTGAAATGGTPAGTPAAAGAIGWAMV